MATQPTPEAAATRLLRQHTEEGTLLPPLCYDVYDVVRAMRPMDSEDAHSYGTAVCGYSGTEEEWATALLLLAERGIVYFIPEDGAWETMPLPGEESCAMCGTKLVNGTCPDEN